MHAPSLHTLIGLAAVVVLALAVATLGVGGGAAPPSAHGGGVAGTPTERGPQPVQTHVEQTPYAVTGRTPDELLVSMVQAAPQTGGRTFFGLTTTALAFRYHRTQQDGGCALRDVGIDLSVRVALPRWTTPPEATPALIRDWAAFSGALRAHEDLHRVIAAQGAERVRLALDGLTAPTCDEADLAARRIADRMGIETEAAHRRYDDETGHGATQGATWPLRRS